MPGHLPWSLASASTLGLSLYLPGLGFLYRERLSSSLAPLPVSLSFQQISTAPEPLVPETSFAPNLALTFLSWKSCNEQLLMGLKNELSDLRFHRLIPELPATLKAAKLAIANGS